jgi:dTDP-4-amino-4,6-dideoxygalactose transaminase
VDVPPERDPGHVYHLFVVRVRSSRLRQDQDARRALQASLATGGIETLIHYPVPIPNQPALDGADPEDCPVATRACDEVLSLPLHPGLSDTDVDRVAASVRRGSAALVRKD